MSNQVISARYMLKKAIGEGGMADVYLALDTKTNTEVAIKILRGDLNEDDVNLARFKREAEAITRLSHPNVVEVFDVGADNNRNYIVMEYVRGKTLKKLIKSRGAMNPVESINIMKQLVSATANAHQNGIIHRDIKSQNVLIKDDGTVKLSDFGIAIANDSAQLTQTKTVMGSVHYLAPELAMGEMATPQSDIYSLGIVFYEMLTGNVPFHGDTAVEIAMKHIHNDMPFVKDFNPALPQAVENIVIKATAKEPYLRYSSCEEMLKDLETCMDFSRSKETRLEFNKIEKPEKKKKVTQQEKEQKTTQTTKKTVKRHHKRRIDLASIALTIGAIVLSLSIVVAIMSLNGSFGSKVKKVEIPNVIDYSIEEAKSTLETLNLKIDVVNYEATNDIPKGHVFRISPAIGTEVSEESFVTLYVSLGTYYTVGNYVGTTINNIQPALEKEGFTVIVNYEENGEYKAGTILSQDIEAGVAVEPNIKRTITFTVASEISFTIPAEIIGAHVDVAKAKLEALGAVVKTNQLSVEENINAETGDYIHPLNTVVDADPAPGSYYTQVKGLYITLYYY